MVSPKLQGLLETLDSRQLSGFQKFVASPYFSEKEVLVQLLDILIQEGKQISKKEVWECLLPRKSFDDLHLRRLCSELIQLFYRYIALENWQSDPVKVNNDLLEGLSSPGYDSHFARWEKKQQALIAGEAPLLSGRFLLQQYRFANLRWEQKERTAAFSQGMAHLEEADRKLARFFAVEKLRLFADSLGYARLTNEQSEVALPDHLRTWISESDLKDHLLIKAYLLVLRLFDPETEADSYQQLKHLLTENVDSFSGRDQKGLFIHLYNYCISDKINKGDHSFYAELFDLFKLGLKEDILLEEGRLSFPTYRNIITVGLREESFEWVEEFIRDYTARLPEEQQKNALDYNLAKVFFHRRQFDRVIGQLSLVEYSDMQYALGSRLLLLKTYYEMEETRSLDSLLEAFRIYLSRKSRLPKTIRDQYLQLLRLVRKLAFVQPFEQEKLAQLQKEIQESNSIEKNWLQEKLLAKEG